MNIHRYISVSCIQRSASRNGVRKLIVRHCNNGKTPAYVQPGYPDGYPWVAYRKSRPVYSPVHMSDRDIDRDNDITRVARRWVS